MVFHGQPSTACLACRQRRLKCDRLPTGCSQCRRKGIQCAGYRDPSALRIKDETARISGKFEQTTSVSDGETGARVLPAPHGCSRKFGRGSPDGCIMVPLGDSPHNLSMAYFFTSYITATTFQSYLPAIFLDSPPTGDACSAAVEATALAAYSRRVRSRSHLKESRKRYTEALAQANDLLSRPETAVLDRTLACVLVLGLFEAIVFEGGGPPASWTAHTNGSLQLLRLRGTRPFRSSLSRKLSLHASNNIKTSCIQRSVAVPDDFIVLDRKLRSFSQHDGPFVMFSPVMHEVASIKARALADADCNLIHDALRLDREILLLCKTVPDWLTYETRPDAESPRWAYKRVCHRYTGVHAAKIWNSVRLLQVFLVSFIQEVVSPPPPQEAGAKWDLSRLRIPDPSKSLARYVAELGDYARRSMDVIATDLLATLPTFMEGGDGGDGRRFAPVARSLAWPLAIVECSDLSPEAARDFAFRQLDVLAGDLNMPEALHPTRWEDSVDDW
ncbi:hypothetical protein E4U42_006320 [Claviceps africana]|uniref:Zn(2)-C6 fungal-type domain-containing protein n=1 Tax=Claviceps africana TaxID=83212 RepID=A0A8K0NFT3_9HYPO|nr:hypothetical protein E4U42_006320 [Claviceps africana]